jgi:dTDP-L-rhamnose 4-epimerase
MMKALVTGGAGFIGSHVAGELAARGWAVTALDSIDPRVHGEEPALPPGVRLVRGDVRDASDIVKALAGGQDAVFHHAAMVGVGRGEEDASEYFDVNVRGTRVLMETIASSEAAKARVVLASSMAVYGEGAYFCGRCGESRTGRRRRSDLDAGRWEPRCSGCGAELEPRQAEESHPARPATAYARSKLEQERVAIEIGRALGIDATALRYHNVYGARMPRDTPYSGVAAVFRSRLAGGLAPMVHEDGRQLRDFVRVEDVVECNLLAAAAPARAVAGEAFNVATGRPRSIMDLAAALCAETSPHLRPALSGAYREGDPRHIIASPAKAERVLGFRARTSFEDGVRRFAHEPLRRAPREVLAA